MDCADFDDYRQALKHVLQTKKQTNAEFSVNNMATSCRVQRTYLSAVLNGRAHLNSDQLFMCCEFLNLSQTEKQLLQLLFELNKSVFQTRKQQLQREFDDLKTQMGKTQNHIDAAEVKTEEGLQEYFLNFTAQLVHMFLTVPKYRLEPQRICSKIGITETVLSTCFAILEKAHLIKNTNGKVEVLQENFHLPDSSTLLPTFRQQARMHALTKLQLHPSPDDYSFSVILSANSQMFRKIKRSFFDYLKETQTDVLNCKRHTEVMQMNFDLIKWS